MRAASPRGHTSRHNEGLVRRFPPRRRPDAVRPRQQDGRHGGRAHHRDLRHLHHAVRRVRHHLPRHPKTGERRSVPPSASRRIAPFIGCSCKDVAPNVPVNLLRPRGVVGRFSRLSDGWNVSKMILSNCHFHLASTLRVFFLLP